VSGGRSAASPAEGRRASGAPSGSPRRGCQPSILFGVVQVDHIGEPCQAVGAIRHADRWPIASVGNVPVSPSVNPIVNRTRTADPAASRGRSSTRGLRPCGIYDQEASAATANVCPSFAVTARAHAWGMPRKREGAKVVHRTARVELRVTPAQRERCFGLLRSEADLWGLSSEGSKGWWSQH
jgi:hypothetical protein